MKKKTQWTVRIQGQSSTLTQGDYVILRDRSEGIARQLFQVSSVSRYRGKTAIFGEYLDGWGSYVFLDDVRDVYPMHLDDVRQCAALMRSVSHRVWLLEPPVGGAR